MKAWHFVGDTLRDGRPVPKDGELLRFNRTPIPCHSGLHAGPTPFDALQYAPGATLCLVECGGIMVPHGDPVDKYACQERTIITRMDTTLLLIYFVRQQALSVAHLWDAPQVVLDFLMGDENCLADAWADARAAVWAAAWADARADAWAAARAAAWAAARADARTEFNTLVYEAFEDWI